LHDTVFQGVRKRPVTAVVEQNGQRSRFKFLVGNVITFAAQQLDGTPHEVHGAKAVGETGVVGSRIHHIGQADLLDASKSLEIRVFNDVEMQLVGNADEAVDGVVEDFLFVERTCHDALFSMRCKGSDILRIFSSV